MAVPVTSPFQYEFYPEFGNVMMQVLFGMMPGVMGTHRTRSRIATSVRTPQGGGTKVLVSKSDGGLYIVESLFFASNGFAGQLQGVYFDIYTNGATSDPVIITKVNTDDTDEGSEYLKFPIFSRNALTIKTRPRGKGGTAWVVYQRTNT